MEQTKQRDKKNFFHVELLEEGTELTSLQFNLAIGMLLLLGFGLNILCMRGFASIINTLNPAVMIVMYLICVIAGTIMVSRSSNTYVCLAGYCLVAIPMGVCISPILEVYTTASVMNAMLITSGITVLMMLAAMVRPQWFAGLGRSLFVSLIIVVIVESVSALFFRTHLDILDYVVAGIFSLYIGYDWHVANLQYKSPANTVRIALNLYLDIINLFVRIVQILGRKRNDSNHF
ncbi:MAG: US12 family protein [Butyrivibrio sp.]|nr:US12 family protein [Butyrivibrio sp.]